MEKELMKVNVRIGQTKNQNKWIIDFSTCENDFCPEGQNHLFCQIILIVVLSDQNHNFHMQKSRISVQKISFKNMTKKILWIFTIFLNLVFNVFGLFEV